MKITKPNRVSVQEIRVPVPKLNFPGFNIENLRTITIGQLAVLLWHLYRCANDPDIGYLDATVPLHDLVSRRLRKTVKLSKRDLEALLWAANMADKQGFFWSPDNKEFTEFIQPMLFSTEAFDRTWNILINTKEYNRIRNETRYIKKITGNLKNKNKRNKRGKNGKCI
jgi:hypothetical protein